MGKVRELKDKLSIATKALKEIGEKSTFFYSVYFKLSDQQKQSGFKGAANLARETLEKINNAD